MKCQTCLNILINHHLLTDYIVSHKRIPDKCFWCRNGINTGNCYVARRKFGFALILSIYRYNTYITCIFIAILVSYAIFTRWIEYWHTVSVLVHSLTFHRICSWLLTYKHPNLWLFMATFIDVSIHRLLRRFLSTVPLGNELCSEERHVSKGILNKLRLLITWESWKVLRNDYDTNEWHTRYTTEW